MHYKLDDGMVLWWVVLSSGISSALVGYGKQRRLWVWGLFGCLFTAFGLFGALFAVNLRDDVKQKVKPIIRFINIVGRALLLSIGVGLIYGFFQEISIVLSTFFAFGWLRLVTIGWEKYIFGELTLPAIGS